MYQHHDKMSKISINDLDKYEDVDSFEHIKSNHTNKKIERKRTKVNKRKNYIDISEFENEDW